MNKKNKTDEKKLEREYVIPLRKQTNKVPRYKKANKAVKAIKEFLAKHMKVEDRDLNKVKLDKFLNEMVWNRGIRNPPAKIKVKAVKENGIVRVEAVEMPTNIKFKKLREEKIKSQSQEVAKKRKAEKVQEEAADKDQNGVEDKKETEEKKEAVVESEQKIEKAEAKEAKHTTEEKSPKEKKNMKVSYNKASQGQ